MHKLVLLRHGESAWNHENRFTGWTDVDLTERGRAEALTAGQSILAASLDFDLAFTSVLKRAIRTLWIVADEMDRLWLPVTHAWQLNERHYGALQGLNKAETARQYGDEQVLIWRRSYATLPPPITVDDERFPGHDPRYRGLSKAQLPVGESLADTINRVVPYWQQYIAPAVKLGRRTLIVAHGNSLRALVKHLDGLSDENILKVNIPTGVPLVYELDPQLKPLANYYLGDVAAIVEAQAEIANQGKSTTADP